MNSCSKKLRGVNKHICINCGNFARSKCTYQSCKGCCVKAQYPCHKHVLNSSNASLPDKTASPSSALINQHSNVISSSGVALLRQRSGNFSQFNNLQTLSPARKPLTRKEASQINEWRFFKLKEVKDKNIETENEAFDRYLQNITLLEEVFAVNSKSGEPVSTEDELQGKSESMISKFKMKLRADPIRTENKRARLRFIVHSGLRKLRSETPTGNEEAEHANWPKKARYLSLLELNQKLSNARTAEHPKSCQQLKDQLFNQSKRLSEQSGNNEDDKPEQKVGIPH